MPFVHLPGQSLFYATRGQSGAPVVFVHGAGDNHLVWNGQLAVLSALVRAYALDLPGHGRSTGMGRRSIYDYAVAVCEFLDKLRLDRAILVGVSMGGAIAQTFGLEFPDRVLGLGLVGTGARLRVAPAFLDGLRNDFPATAHLIVENCFAPGALDLMKRQSEKQLLRCGKQVVYDDYAACDSFSVITRLNEIHAPALILCGDQDRMTPVKYSQYLAAQIPNAQLKIIPGAGHMVMLEKPEQVTLALREWIMSLPAAP
jgi:pimeloyl-ACP methyl ester carboxylesterase